MSNKQSKSLLDKYELGCLLGCGTFAKVYHASPVAGGEPVAVKVLDNGEVMGTAGVAPRVLREVTATRQLRHPNVLRLHEVLATRAKIYLVMELATGGDLLSRLVALPQRRLPEHVVHRVFVQLGARRGPAGSSATPPRRRTRWTSTAAGSPACCACAPLSSPSPPCLSSLCGRIGTERWSLGWGGEDDVAMWDPRVGRKIGKLLEQIVF
jgi:hypothetical protein